MMGFSHSEKERLSNNRLVRGFTLVELQVALLLVALIAVLLVGALRLSSQTWTKVTEKQDISERRFMVSRLLRKHLSNMRFVRVRSDSSITMMSFLGNGEQLHFLAPYPSFKNDGSLYWWSVKNRWDEAKNSNLLVMDYRPYLAGKPVIIDVDGSISYQDQLPASLVIAEGVKLSNLHYYSRDYQDVESWGDQWEPSTATPQVIRFTLTETDHNGFETEFSEIAVAPRFASQQLYVETVRQ
jgi:type II secretory pathway component PulJ